MSGPSRQGAAFNRPILGAAVLLCCAALNGCAAFTNPVANGIPANLVGAELLAAPKEGMETLPLSLLGQAPPDVYRLGPGDILGIYIAGILGEPDQAPPVNVLVDGVETTSLGFPVPVRDNGTLTLPLIEPLSVEGMTIEEVEREIIRAYTEEPEPIIKPGRERVIVTLARPRLTRVMVIRQDSPTGGITARRPGFVRATREFRGGTERLFRGRTGGTGTAVYLPAYQNDVLNAITQSGGLPGLEAVNEIIIQRRPTAGSDGLTRQSPVTHIADEDVEELIAPDAEGAAPDIIRIPLRVWPGEPRPFRPEDVVLNTGDVVFIEARDTEVFYTGGLLPSGEYPIPRDYDLDAVEAVAQVGGPLINGGVNSNNLSGALVAAGIGSPSPRLLTVLRHNPDGGQCRILVDLFAALRDPRHNLIIKPGDVLILQETKHQALGRYITQVFNFSLFSDVISRTNTTGTTALIVP